MNDLDRDYIIIEAGRKVGPNQMAALVAMLSAGEQLALARQEPPIPNLDDLIGAQKKAEYDAESAMWRAQQPRSPWDRGSKGDKVKESLTAMMTRLGTPPKERWKKPTLEERNLCDNCDGAPDGGHVGDAWCRHTLEDEG